MPVNFQIGADTTQGTAAITRMNSALVTLKTTETGVEQESAQVSRTMTQMGESMRKTAEVTVLGRDKMVSYSNMVEGTGVSVLHASGAFGTMDKAMGGIASVGLNVAGALDNIADRSNALTSSIKNATTAIGGFGTAALIAAAAFTGWKIGTWLNDMKGTTKEIVNAILPMTMLIDVYKEATTALGNFMAGVDDSIDITARATQQYYAAHAALMAFSNGAQDAGNKLAAVLGEVENKITESQQSASQLSQKYMEEYQSHLAAANDANLKAHTDASAKLINEDKKRYDEEMKLAGEAYQKFGSFRLQELNEAKHANEEMSKSYEKSVQDRLAAEKKAHDEFMKLYGELASGFSKSANAVTQDVFAQATAGVKNYNAALKEMVSAHTWDEVIAAVQKFGDGVNANNPAMQGAYDNLLKLRNGYEAMGSKAVEASVDMKQQTEAAKHAYEANEKLAQAFAFLGDIIGGTMGEAMRKYGEVLHETGSKTMAMVAEIGSALTGLSQEFDGAWGTILAGTGAFLSTFESMLQQGFSQAQSIIGGLASGLSAAMDKAMSGPDTTRMGSDEAHKGAAIGSVIGGVAGSMFGPLGAMVGSALGKAVGAFIGALMAHDWLGDTKKLTDKLFNGISDSLNQQIAELAKKLKDAGAAVTLSLGDIIAEQGITQDNFSGFIQSMMYGWEAMNQGKISAEDLAATLAEVFPQMADAAIQFGGTFIDQLDAVIQKMAETGVGVDTLKAYMETLQQKIDAIRSEALKDMITQVEGLGNAFAEMMKKMEARGTAAGGNADTWQMFLSDTDLNHMKHRFEEMQRYFDETVADMRAQGMSMSEIFHQMGPLWDQLSEAAKRFGFDTSKEFKQLSLVMQEFKDHAGQFAHLDFLSNIAKDEARMGALTKATFHDLENSVSNTAKSMGIIFKTMSDGTVQAFAKSGASGKASIQAILPSLIEVIGLHNQTGMAISANDKALIALAQKYGLLPQDTSQVGLDPTITAMNNMIKILEKIQTALDTLVKTLTGLNGTQVDFDVIGHMNWEEGALGSGGHNRGGGAGSNHHDNNPPPPPTPVPIGGSRAGLQGWEMVTAPEAHYVLHRGEVIGGKDVAGGSPGGRAPINVSFAPHPGMSPHEYEAMIKRVVKDMDTDGEGPWLQR